MFPLQCPDRVINVDRIAEAGVGIDDDGQRYCIADDRRARGDFAQSNKAEIWHSEPGIADTGASDVDGLVAQIP